MRRVVSGDKELVGTLYFLLCFAENKKTALKNKVY